MVTFTADSLDFRDAEEARFGANGDYGVGYDSNNDALTIEDRVNNALAQIPRNVGTDLIGGKYAETVSEGKALADDGNVYDSIQDAVDNASSWVKVGPGEFNESVTVSSQGLTIVGFGERTKISFKIDIQADNCDISDLFLGEGLLSDYNNIVVDNIVSQGGITLNGENSSIINSKIVSSTIVISGDNGMVSECTVQDCSGFAGIRLNTCDNTVLSNNKVESPEINGIYLRDSGADTADDCVVYGNIISNSGELGIDNRGFDSIIAKNRLINTDGIDNRQTTVTDSNLITE